MPLSVSETRNFVLDRRTVSWTDSYNVSGVHSRFFYIIKNYLVCSLVCVRQPAADLVDIVFFVLVKETELDDLFVALLLGHRIVI